MIGYFGKDSLMRLQLLFAELILHHETTTPQEKGMNRRAKPEQVEAEVA